MQICKEQLRRILVESMQRYDIDEIDLTSKDNKVYRITSIDEVGLMGNEDLVNMTDAHQNSVTIDINTIEKMIITVENMECGDFGNTIDMVYTIGGR